MTTKNHWLCLIISLPTTNATARMRIWRALKSLGCGVLRDGVYLLPENVASKLALERQEAEIIAAGGTAQIVILSSTYPLQDQAFRELFNRTDDYTAHKQNIELFLAGLPAQNILASKRALKKLARDFAALSAIDFFPGTAQEQIALLLDKATAELNAVAHPDEPHATTGKIIKLPRDEFQNRLWATRKKMWVDRMASAWLIRRFIDTHASFQWLNKPQDCPKTALGFDFDGATFTHIGPRVTYEVLLASFNLESDPALQRIAAVVHFLDVGGIPLAEAHGLELVLKGMRERCANDNNLLHEATIIFDDLYLTYTNEHGN